MTKTCSNWVDTMQISQNCTAIKRTDELPCQGTGSSDLWILLPRPHSLTRFIYYIYFIIIDPDPGSPYPQWRTQGGCTGCTCIPPPPPVHPPPGHVHPPPPPQPRWGSGQQEKNATCDLIIFCRKSLYKKTVFLKGLIVNLWEKIP